MLLPKSGSSPVVGSSNKTISGSVTSARAKPGAFFHAAADFRGKFIAHAVETHLRQRSRSTFFSISAL